MAADSLTTRITEIRRILESGVVEDEFEGQRIKYDHDTLRTELDKLLKKQNAALRPTVLSVNLGGF